MDASPRSPKWEKSEILVHVLKPEAFHARRYLALQRPDRARDKLSGYALLKIKIVKARNLPAADLHGSSDPYASVYVDDVFKAWTRCVKVNRNPVWNWEGSLEIKNPASVVLLQVLDFDFGVSADDLLGFVEFPVSDLPPGTTVQGWCRLSPPALLTGKAPDRLARPAEPGAADCGEVLVQMTLEIASGDPGDELHAWMLPSPKFFAYPQPGYVMQNKFDPQGLIDNIMEIKSGLLHCLLNPCLGCVWNLLSWRAPLLSLFCLATLVCTSLRPQFFLSGILAMFGVLLLWLRDPQRRISIVAHPATVPLDDYGFQLMSETQSTEAMLRFVERIVSVLRGTVCDQDKLRAFAAFASYEGMAVCDYASLKRQLLEATSVKDPFLKVEGSPLQPGCLVSWRRLRGEVVECLNPKEKLLWRYLVRFDTKDTETQEIAGEELETRVDLRWMSKPAVLTLIPDSVERMAVSFQPTIAWVNVTVKGLWHPAADVLAWRNPWTSCGLAGACLLLSPLFLWVQRPCLALVTVCMFTGGLPLIKNQLRLRDARRQRQKYAAKAFRKWPFLAPTTVGDAGGRSTNSFGVVFDALEAFQSSAGAVEAKRSIEPTAGPEEDGDRVGLLTSIGASCSTCTMRRST